MEAYLTDEVLEELALLNTFLFEIVWLLLLYSLDHDREVSDRFSLTLLHFHGELMSLVVSIVVLSVSSSSKKVVNLTEVMGSEISIHFTGEWPLLLVLSTHIDLIFVFIY